MARWMTGMQMISKSSWDNHHIHTYKTIIVVGLHTRVGVKYSWPSTQVSQIYTKYKYWSSTHFFEMYLSTSSTFISSTSTSTSTHIKICSKVRMDIQGRVNFGRKKWKAFPKSCLIKSRWPYSMQSRFWVDKLKGLFQKSCFCSKVKMAIFYAE